MKNRINFAKEGAKKILLDLKLTLGYMLIVAYTIVSVFTSNACSMQGYKFERKSFKLLIGGSTASNACSMQGDKNQKKEKFNYGKKSINHIYKSSRRQQF